MTHSFRDKQCGFTLIELTITVGVALILASIALPSFYAMQQDMRVSSDANKLHGLIHHARSAASKTQRPVTLCPMEESWGVGAFTTQGECTNTPGSDPERRSLDFDGQVTVDVDWSNEGLTFTGDGAVTSSGPISPVVMSGSSPKVDQRRITVTTTGTSKIERLGGGQ